MYIHPTASWTAKNLHHLAMQQRNVILSILLFFLMYGSPAIVNQFDPRLVPILRLLLFPLILGLGVLQLYFMARLADAVRANLVLYILLFLIPCIQILALVRLNQRAIVILRNHGLPVGFLGVPRSAIDDLETLVERDEEGDDDDENENATPAKSPAD